MCLLVALGPRRSPLPSIDKVLSSTGFYVGRNYKLVANFPTQESSEKLILTSNQKKEFIAAARTTDIIKRH